MVDFNYWDQTGSMGPAANGAGVSYGQQQPGPWNPSVGGPMAGQQQGALSGNPGGSFWNQAWIGPTAAALLGGRNFRQSLAGAGQAIAQTMPLEQKRQALNGWLQAKSSGDETAINAAQTKLFQVDPELAQSVASFQMVPHPKQFTALPTGQVAVEDPYAATAQSAVQIVDPNAGSSGANGMPAGFIFPTAKNYTDASTGETGLIDQNGKKWITGAANPSSDQAQASGAAQLARQADALVRTSEGGQTGVGTSIERLAMKTPVLGPLVSGPEARSFEDGKNQFMQAVRSLAISAKLNPESAEFTEQALFPGQNATKEEIGQKDAYRQQIISNLERRAGPFAQQAQPQTAAPAATPPPQAVHYLKQNPSLRGAFDQKYGAGASAQILGQ